MLKDVNEGKSCVIEKIQLPEQMTHHLQALGMTDKAAVSVVKRKGKGIVIIKLRGSRFALGYNITKNIKVRC